MSTRQAALGAGMGGWLVAYFLRAAGDLQESVLTWFSPLGWVEKAQPVVEPRYGVFPLFVAATVGLVGASFAIQRRRDCGAAVVAGKATRPPRLAFLDGLVPAELRLNLGWMTGCALTLGFFGVLMALNVDDAGDRYAMGAVGFLTFTLTLLGTFAALLLAYQLGKVVKAETGGHSRTILARPQARGASLLAHVVGDVLLLAVLLAASGGGVMLGLAAQETDLAWDRLAGGLAMWFCAALVPYALGLALFGWLPRATANAAGALILVWFLLELVAGPMDAPEWLLNLSLWHWVPAVPDEAASGRFAAFALALALVLSVVGWAGYRRRDLLPTELEL